MTTDRGAVLGVLNRGTLLDSVMMEMLNHQGIHFEEVNPGSERRTYPAILFSSDSSGLRSEARGLCSAPDAVIAGDRFADLSGVLKCLSGLEDRREDRLSLFVNAQEAKLVAAVRGAFSDSGARLLRKSFWPGKADACCVISTDVDWLTYSPYHAAVAKGRPSPGRLAGLVYGSLTGKNFGLNFDVMADALRTHGGKSTVFIRSAYEKGEENLGPALAMLREEGFEIGLHGSEDSHTNPDTLNSQLAITASRSGVKPTGVRHHILKMNIPETWEVEASAGLDYDATFYYNRFFGFRAETCYPFHPFADRKLPLLELPTSFMDWTALNRGLRRGSAEKIMEVLMEGVEHYHGLLMVNFHNTYLNRETFPDILELYRGVIERASERGYWLATAGSCSKWWRSREASGPATLAENGGRFPDGDLQLEEVSEKEVGEPWVPNIA